MIFYYMYCIQILKLTYSKCNLHLTWSICPSQTSRRLHFQSAIVASVQLHLSGMTYMSCIRPGNLRFRADLSQSFVIIRQYYTRLKFTLQFIFNNFNFKTNMYIFVQLFSVFFLIPYWIREKRSIYSSLIHPGSENITIRIIGL